ncbi:MAG: hypothetical protein KGH94_02140 [Candidatus Micrarchaeota archaeon]|nr:hypothetical protein [Candidatus Micrarchaeota archaeon]
MGTKSLGRNSDLGLRDIDGLSEIASELSKLVRGGKRAAVNGYHTREELVEVVVLLRGSVRKGIRSGRILKREVSAIAYPGGTKGKEEARDAVGRSFNDWGPSVWRSYYD